MKRIKLLTKPPLTFIDLFCGIGGFHQALSKLGGKCVFACDIDQSCRDVYQQNYGILPASDIKAVNPANLPNFDILCAGFPCQPFSNGGKKQTFADPRGLLFDYIVDIAKIKKPRFMFLENVKHIKKVGGGKVFQHILDSLNNNDYHSTIFELSPHQLGIPQQRERVIFVCIRKDIYNPQTPIELHLPPVPMKSIFETDPKCTQKYTISPETLAVLQAWDEMIHEFAVDERLSPTILCHEFYRTYTPTEYALLPEWKRDCMEKNNPLYLKYQTLWDAWYLKHHVILSKCEVNGKLEWQAGLKQPNDSIFNHFIQIRQSGIRVKRTEYFPTLVAIVQTPIYGHEQRYLTPRECARLQSFPDTFQLPTNDKVAYKQLGNSVNVDVIHKVVSETFRVYGL